SRVFGNQVPQRSGDGRVCEMCSNAKPAAARELTRAPRAGPGRPSGLARRPLPRRGTVTTEREVSTSPGPEDYVVRDRRWWARGEDEVAGPEVAGPEEEATPA